MLDFVFNEYLQTGISTAYDRTLKEFGLYKLTGPGGMPGDINASTGVFRRGDQTYISLGIFEDLVLNLLYGSGIDFEEIQDGKSLSVGMDS